MLFRFTVLTIAAFSMLLGAGCNGERVTAFDRITPEGVWAADGTLVRYYEGVTLRQAVDAVEQYIKQTEGWSYHGREVEIREAEVYAKDAQGLPIQFEIWAPGDGRPLEIGFGTEHEDRFLYADTLSSLEKLLPGKRVPPPQPR